MSVRRVLWAEGRLHVDAVVEDDGTLMISGQDLSGSTPGGDDYEYWITVRPGDVARVAVALGGRPGDVLDLLVAHGEEIVSRGERSWLSDHGIDATLSTTPPWLPVRRTSYGSRRLTWEPTEDEGRPHRSSVDGKELVIQLGDFPDEPLYTLFVDGLADETFDDWPTAWTRSERTIGAKSRRLHVYEHSHLMTSAVLELVNDPSAVGLRELSMGTSVHLSGEACTALVASVPGQTITRIECDELFLRPEELQLLLTLPALVKLAFIGGVSSDWSGPTYHYPTLDERHVDVLMTDTNAQKLRHLRLINQQLGMWEERLRAALPHLEELEIDDVI